MTVLQMRQEIFEIERRIDDHILAHKYLDRLHHNTDRELEGLRHALVSARLKLITQSQWQDLITDAERDEWVINNIPCAEQHLRSQFQAASEAGQIEALRRRTRSAETQLAGANAQIALLISAAERALKGDTEVLVQEIKRAKS
jgi:hypothetical protein